MRRAGGGRPGLDERDRAALPVRVVDLHEEDDLVQGQPGARAEWNAVPQFAAIVPGDDRGASGGECERDARQVVVYLEASASGRGVGPACELPQTRGGTAPLTKVILGAGDPDARGEGAQDAEGRSLGTGGRAIASKRSLEGGLLHRPTAVA